MSTSVSAHAFGRRQAVEVPCGELIRLLKEKYASDFLINFSQDPAEMECPSFKSAAVRIFYDLDATSQIPGAPDFYGFAKKRIRTVEYIPKTTTGALADANFFFDKVRLYGNNIFRSGEEYSSSTLYHEARHMDWSDPRHVTCSRGSYRGIRGGCDAVFLGDQIEAGSGYHYDVRYFHWILTAETRYDRLDYDILKTQYRSILFNRFNEFSNADLKKWLVP